VDNAALFQMICEIVGGLGLFLLGMKNMSDGMQAVAGSSLRRMISIATDNRFLASIVGVVVTGVVQSSSVTTVMVIGFVNSGVMNLTQAIGVIMGANIGTTITGWIIVLKIGKFGLPLLGVSAFVYLFSKGDRWRFWAMALMGVGMVFFGLELMKNACSIIKDMPKFMAWFEHFQADSYPGVLKCALAGCVLTMLVQSSSATLGITIALASQGVIPFETAAALVLGENIGTTITAFLASLGTTMVARRAAYFHVIFNLVGVFWITLIFQWYIVLVQSVIGVDVDLIGTATELKYEVLDGTLTEVSIEIPVGRKVINAEAHGAGIRSMTAEDTRQPGEALRIVFDSAVTDRVQITVQTDRHPKDDEALLGSPSPDGRFRVTTGKGKESYPHREYAIATTHTLFNVANTLIFFPFLPLFGKLLTRFVPSKDFKEKPRLTDLDIRILETPLMAIEQSRREIEKMGVGCSRMLEWLQELRQQDNPDKAMADRLKHREQVLDSMQDELTEFVTKLLSANIPLSVAEEARGQLRMADEYESISDYIADLDKFDRKLRRDGHRFSEVHRTNLSKLNGNLSEYVGSINEAMVQENRNVLKKTETTAKRVRAEIKQLRKGHLDDLSAGTTAPVVSVAFLASLNAYSRVLDHTYNIAEIVSGEK
jgi:Na/Pi-cotransporter